MTDVNGDGKPDTRIRDLTVEQAGQIYFRDYWYPAYCQLWPDDIALFVFDSAVQHGVKRLSSCFRKLWVSLAKALTVSPVKHPCSR